MKLRTFRFIVLLLVVSFSLAKGQSLKSEHLYSSFGNSLSKLRAVEVLSDYEPVGWTGKNKFYQLSKDILGSGTEQDFKRMLHDRNPVVRAMGLLCLAQTDSDKHFLTLLSHTKNKEEVSLAHGCVVRRITVGEFAKWLLYSPYFLEPEGKKPSM